MDLELRLQRSGLPFYVQMRDQIIEAICSGRLHPGDKLPTVEAIAQQHGVAKNTALRAYQELQREGWLANTPGLGTVVQNLPGGGWDATDLVVELVARFHDNIAQIRATGLSAEDFAAISAQLISEKWSGKLTDRDYFVVISEDVPNKERDIADVEGVVGLPARWVHFRDVQSYGIWALGDVRRVKAIVAAFWRLKEVKDRLGSLSIPMYPHVPVTDPKTFAEAAKHNRPEVRVGIVAHHPDFIEPLGFYAGQCLSEATIVGCATIGAPDAMENLLPNVDIVAADFWACDERLLHLTQGKPALVLGNRADPNFFQTLRQLLCP